MVQNHRDLIVWQLGTELRRHVLEVTRHRKPDVDKDFIWDIRRAARSIPTNTAEGFGRFRPIEFHRFLEFAKGSVEELESHFEDGYSNGYFTRAQLDIANRLIRRITPAMLSLMAYLRSKEAEAHFKRLRAASTRRDKKRVGTPRT